MSNDYNAADRGHVKHAQREVRGIDGLRTETIRSIMSSVGGRAWMQDILEFCHVFSTSFPKRQQPDGSFIHADPIVMAFMEGERNVGLQFILAIMQNCPEYYLEMTREKDARDLATAATRPQRPPAFGWGPPTYSGGASGTGADDGNGSAGTGGAFTPEPTGGSDDSTGEV
jgi:hypothetical protein